LIIAPFILGLEAQSVIALWISVVAGAGLIIYSLLTHYQFSVPKLIPFKLHLILDLSAAAFFIIAPFVLGFEGIAQIYYWVMGSGVLLVVGLTNTKAK